MKKFKCIYISASKFTHPTLYKEISEMFNLDTYPGYASVTTEPKCEYIYETKRVNCTDGTPDNLITELQEWSNSHENCTVDLESYTEYDSTYARFNKSGWRKTTDEERKALTGFLRIQKDTEKQKIKDQQTKEREDYERLKIKYEG